MAIFFSFVHNQILFQLVYIFQFETYLLCNYQVTLGTKSTGASEDSYMKNKPQYFWPDVLNGKHFGKDMPQTTFSSRRTYHEWCRDKDDTEQENIFHEKRQVLSSKLSYIRSNLPPPPSVLKAFKNEINISLPWVEDNLCVKYKG